MTVPTELQKNQNSETEGQFNKNCTLLIPGLFDLTPARDEYREYRQNQFKELELFLARAKVIKQISHTCDSVLFDLFDIPLPQEQDLPVAPVTYLGDTGVSAPNWCLRADPVNLIPDRDDLVLSGPEILSLTMSEAEHLAAELNNLFVQDGWHLEVASPTRWYLHLLDKPNIRTWSLLQVNGQSIGHFLPEGPQAKQWVRLMNEVQMVLHGSEVNRNRQASGQPIVSSLWFWGGGQLPEFGHSRWSQVWGDEVLGKGLAKLTRTPCASLPENAHAWVSEVSAPGEHLLIYPEMSQQGYLVDSDAWTKQMTIFQQKWLSPLLEGLKKGDIGLLTINTCDGQSFQMTRGRLKRWWVRRKPLYHFARQS